MKDYYIPGHVRFAFESDAVIFLDFRLDRYSALVGPKARAFRAMLSETLDRLRPITASDHEDQAEEQDLQQAVFADLLENSLLTTNLADRTATSFADISLPEEDLLEPQPTETVLLDTRDALRFVVSCVVATWRLKCTSMETTVRALERRKRMKRKPAVIDASEVRRLVHIYNRLRPLFPKNFLCLFDSVSLIEFLARYNCFPDMIFAVKLDPWSAHCWVQHGSVALNQELAEACTYRPIMSI